MARVTTCGVRVPATRTAPITTSAVATASAMASSSARQVSTPRHVLDDVAQFARIAIECRNARARRRGAADGRKSDRARAQDDDARGRHSRRSAEQNAAAAGTGAQQVRGDRNRHLAGDLADRGEHRQAAVVLLDDLAADGGQAAFRQRIPQGAVRHGQVVEGHQRHARPAEAQFLAEWGAPIFGSSSARWITSAGE